MSTPTGPPTRHGAQQHGFVPAGQAIKINSGVAHAGAYAATYEQVVTGCTIKLGAGATFTANSVALAFNGPFNVESSGKGVVTFAKSAWRTTSMNYDLSSGPDSDFKTDAARLEASVGDLNVRTGALGEVQLQDMTGTVNALKAAGSIALSGGDKLLFSVNDTNNQAAACKSILRATMRVQRSSRQT